MSTITTSRSLAARLLRTGPLLLAGSLLLTAALGTGILHIGFDTSLSSLLARNDPYLSQVEEMEAQFDPPDTVSFAVV